MTLAGSIFLIAVGRDPALCHPFPRQGPGPEGDRLDPDDRQRRRPGHRDLAVGRLVSSLEATEVLVDDRRAVDPEYRDPRPR